MNTTVTANICFEETQLDCWRKASLRCFFYAEMRILQSMNFNIDLAMF